MFSLLHTIYCGGNIMETQVSGSGGTGGGTGGGGGEGGSFAYYLR